MSYLVSTQLRPRQWPSLVFMAVGIVFAAIIYYQRIPDKFPMILSVGMIIASLVFRWAISKSYLQIDNDGITHKTVFKEKTIPWSSVKRTELVRRATGKSNQLNWLIEGETDSIEFVTSNYSRISLRQVAEAIVEKCPWIEKDDRIIRMSRGEFPYYIF